MNSTNTSHLSNNGKGESSSQMNFSTNQGLGNHSYRVKEMKRRKSLIKERDVLLYQRQRFSRNSVLPLFITFIILSFLGHHGNCQLLRHWGCVSFIMQMMLKQDLGTVRCCSGGNLGYSWFQLLLSQRTLQLVNILSLQISSQGLGKSSARLYNYYTGEQGKRRRSQARKSRLRTEIQVFWEVVE